MRKDKESKRFLLYSAVCMLVFSSMFHYVTRAQASATISQSGWYRIGQNGTALGGTSGSRAAAHFIVMDRTSAQHQTVEFLAYINFHQMPSIVVLNNSYYNASKIPIPKIRILAPSSTYAGSAVEVYINSYGNNAESFLIEDNTQSNGWTSIDWQQVSTGTGDQDGVPAGFTACVLGLQNLVTGYVTKSGKQTSYVNGNFYTSGNILLGKTTQSNSAYKLDINGQARANEIVVNSTGADFVFDSGYQLRPLNIVDNYIKTHHHLPDIPSAKEMQASGLPVGSNQTRLLQKIEELTLYLISQQEQIDRLNQRVDSLKRENLQLAAQNKILKDFELRLRKLEAKPEATSDKAHLSTFKTRPL